MKKEKRVLALYLTIVFAISAPVEALWIYTGEAGLAQLLMFVPLAAAFALKLIFYRRQSLLGLGFGKPIYFLYATLIPLAYIGLSYLLYWLLGTGTFAGAGVLVEAISSQINIKNLPVAMIVGIGATILVNIPFTLGEEVGWRGLMYPLMHKLWGRNKALIASGGIWALWHLPLLISGDYMAGAPILYKAPMFIMQILALTVIASWLRAKSSSVWPAAIWHAAHNALDQSVFRSMTTAANSAYFISETGFITTLCAVACAVLILAYGKFGKGAGA